MVTSTAGDIIIHEFLSAIAAEGTDCKQELPQIFDALRQPGDEQY